MSLGRIPRAAFGLCLSLVMLGGLLPGSLLAAPERRPRNYIVTLATADAGTIVWLSSRSGRRSARERAVHTRAATRRLVDRYGVKVRHRFTTVMAGFSARLTPEQAASLRGDAEVVSVRPARRFRIASEIVPDGIRRVNAAPVSSPTPDVDVDIAIIDTGIGPVGGNELNVAGGVNCAADGLPADVWQDLYPVGHGTHVAGTAAARDGNGVGVVGTAPGARLWAVRIFDESGWGDESTVLCGLDWVTSTHLPGLAPPGTQPIEVVNMSIEGSRIALVEECLPGDPDPIHAAVCAAFQAGITIVAAAGNGATDASAIAPAGYDQVITVGAITDLDGAGWGEASDGCSGERDDAWASYSNYGTDVDILAPGSCVESLQPSESGDVTKRLTGTSMAAPHVAGAVARFLATHPATPPGQMRKLVRAAGRLDWDIRSDPIWSGVSDRDAPGRLLDVAALLGPGELRVWLSIDGFRLAGGPARRQARVDVQRGGGYAGGVRLDVVGLRPKVGSARFDRPGPMLKGLNGLGARLSLRLEATSHDGRRELSVTARGPAGIAAGSHALGLVVDRVGPKVRDLAARVRDDNVAMAENGAVKAFMSWTATDALSGVETSTLQRQIDERTWVAVRGDPGHASVTLRPGRQERFRVRSTDGLGNDSLSAPLTVGLAIRDSSSPAWRRPGGGWQAKSASSAFGGSLLVGVGRSKGLLTGFQGRVVAVVAPIGPKRGTLRLRIDGGRWKDISLNSPTGQQRSVVFSRRVEAAAHTLEVRGQSGHTALDAILVIR